MKKIVYSVSLIASMASLLSCNDKLEIAAPYKNITVVYGLLNIADTAHYVRIQKAFMDQNQSGIDMAKVADSSFYNVLDVKIKELNSGGTVLNTIDLDKVDLTLEGYPKQSGAFFNTPNYAYKFKRALNAANTYRIIITNKNTGNVDSAETAVIGTGKPGDFNNFGIVEWRSDTVKTSISFFQTFTDAGKLRDINFAARIPDNVGDAQLVLRFNWTDSNTATGASVKKSADFTNFNTNPLGIENQSPLNKTFGYITPNRDFYVFLRDALGVNPSANQTRILDSCDMFLYVAGIEYKRYRLLNENKGGITADEIRPMYSNIKGANVLGLFSTKAFVAKYNIGINKETRDSILKNNLTSDLNIRFYQ